MNKSQALASSQKRAQQRSSLVQDTAFISQSLAFQIVLKAVCTSAGAQCGAKGKLESSVAFFSISSSGMGVSIFTLSHHGVGYRAC